MINYTKINSVLPLISKAVRQEDTNLNLLSYTLDAYRLIQGPTSMMEEVAIYEIKDHKVELCSDIKTINLVTYLNQPTDSNCENCLNIVAGESQEEYNLTDSTNPCAGNYAIAHKLYLSTDYYNQNFAPLKYVGTSSFVCSDCYNRFCHDCNETFSVDHNKVMWTSFKDGYVCVMYDKELKDDDGNFLIIDDMDVKKYLALYAELEHFRNRWYSHEEGAGSFISNLESKVNLWYNKSKGTLNKISINAPLLKEMTNGSYNARFFNMLPYNYRQRYEFGSINYKNRY